MRLLNYNFVTRLSAPNIAKAMLLSFFTLLLFTGNEAKAQCSADFNFSVSNMDVSFNDASSSQWGHWQEWDFGDGSTARHTANPNHSYTTADTFTVCLKITDSITQCTDQVCKQVIITCPTFDFTFNISGQYVIFNVDTTGFYTNFSWTYGDGNSSSSGNISHDYPDTGVYQACLYAVNPSTMCTVQVCKSIHITSYSQRGISGLITSSTQVPYPGKAYLIQYNSTDSSLQAVDSIDFWGSDTDYVAYYTFNVHRGTYYIKVALNPTAPGYSSHIPTYSGDEVMWANATAIVVGNQNQTMDIDMVAGTNPGGPGFIGGLISQGANKKGDPLGGIEVLLLDAGTDQPLMYTYSKSDGTYSFSNVPIGTFKVYAEVLGLPTAPAVVVITEENKAVEGVQIEVNKTGVITYIEPTIIGENTSMVVYPNPAINNLYLKLDAANSGPATFEIFDVAGRVIRSQSIYNTGEPVDIDVSNISSGVYYLKVIPKNNQPSQVTFIKQ